MAHINPKSLGDYPWPIRWLLKRQERIYGEVLAPAWLWGRQPGLFFGMLLMLGLFRRSAFPISACERALASIRIAQLNGCEFCVDLNAHQFLAAQGEAEKAEAVSQWADQKPIFTVKEQAILAYAEAMTINCQQIDQKTVDELRQHLSDDEVVALSAWVGFQNMSAKFNAALGAESHGFCQPPQ